MPTKSVVLALSALCGATFVVAACSSQDDTISAENASIEDVAEKVAKTDLRPIPGRWETRMTIDKIEIPGVPPEMRGIMNSQLGKVQTSISCLTEEQAEKADGEFFKPANDSGCKYNKFEMGGGTIEADMTCEDNGMTQKMNMTGTYGKESYAMKMRADGDMQGQLMSMSMSMESKRVGECDGKEET